MVYHWAGPRCWGTLVIADKPDLEPFMDTRYSDVQGRNSFGRTDCNNHQISSRMENTTTRRFVLTALAAGPLLLAGCLGSDDDEFRLDPEEFEDASLHLVAEGVARTDLELERIRRDEEGWIQLDLRFDGALDEHLEIPPGFNVTTPVPPDQVHLFVLPPGYEPIIDWYARAVEEGEDGAGLSLRYEGAACTASTFVDRNRVDWYLDDQIELSNILAELRGRYEIEC